MKVTITKKQETHSFDLENSDSVLLAGLRSGLALDYECATGTCGTCRAKLVSGDLDLGWPEAPGRKNLKTKSGEFLMCQARTRSDCEIKVPGVLAKLPPETIRPRHFSGTLKDCQKHTDDVMSFNVELNENMSFQAGQFVIMQSSSIEGYRAYSMVSDEIETRSLEFVIKKLPSGEFSDWIFSSACENTELSLYGPFGKAIFEADGEDNILCITGGSGIAGMMSILETACRKKYFADKKGELFFGVRTVDDIFFLNRLENLAQQFPENLTITIALSDQATAPELPTLPANVKLTTGFVHLAARNSTLTAANTIAYIAGPPPMVDGAIKDLIVEAGFGADRIRYDKFA